MSNTKPLLEIVQDILSIMNDDEVNSIHDTTRASDVAKLVRDAYVELTAFDLIPELMKITQLDPVSDSDFPVVLKVPSDVTKVQSIRYNCRLPSDEFDYYKDIPFVTPSTFLTNHNFTRKLDDSYVDMVLLGGAGISESPSIRVRNDSPPTAWTTFDDTHIIFNSWHKGVENTMQNVNSAAIVSYSPQFLFEDSFTMPVDLRALTYIIARAKNLSFDIYKGYVPAELVRSERKSKAALNNAKTKLTGGLDWSAFGRRP